MKMASAHIIEQIVTAFMVLLVMGMTGILFYFLSLRLGDIAKENQAYDRYNACVLSVPADDRDIEKIDRCWEAAQEDTGIDVKRYDNFVEESRE